MLLLGRVAGVGGAVALARRRRQEGRLGTGTAGGASEFDWGGLDENETIEITREPAKQDLGVEHQLFRPWTSS